MPVFDVTGDIKEVERMLTQLERKQIPFATSQAINDTAFDARKELTKQTPQKLDRPIKFTINAYRVIKSTKRNLTAVVFVEDKRYQYLKWAIEGGTRRARRNNIGVPAGIKLNRYGNIPGRKKGLVKKKRQFIGTINNTTGVWERVSKQQLKLIVTFKRKVEYRPILPFEKIVEGIAMNKFKRHFDKRLRNAIKTAR